MVRILQQALEASGNSPGTIDSLFGTKTQAALRAFQRSARLPETGVANRDTWLAIAPFINYDNVYLRRGDRGMLVVILQTALYNAGRFIGGASAPVVIPMIAAGHGFGFAIGCVSCIYVVAFIAMFFIPEKKGATLE